MSIPFNDAADRLLITANVPLSNSPFTHMGYVRGLATTGGLQTIVARIDDDLDPYIWFGVLGDGSFYYEDSNAGGGDFGNDLTYGVWTHVTFARQTDLAKLWINGLPINSTGANGGLGVSTRYEVGGWRSSNGNRWNGDQGVLKAWSAFLTDEQVLAEYGKAEAQLLTNLYGVWPLLNDGQDYSGNDNHWNVSGITFTGAEVPDVDYGEFAGSASVVAQIMEHRRQLCC